MRIAPKLYPFEGERIEWAITQPYRITLSNLAATLKRPKRWKMIAAARLGGGRMLRSYLESTAGDLGLMILGAIAHGQLFNNLGDGPIEAQMFLVGNPLIALGMMRAHAEAGVYAPLRVMFSASGPDTTMITYDRPSRMFGQWPERVFADTGKMLDEKLEILVQRIGAVV